MNHPQGPLVIAYDGSAAARQAVAEAAELMGSRRALVLTVWEAGLAYATGMPADGFATVPTVDPETAHEVDRGLHEQAEGISREGAQLAQSLGLEAESLAVSDDSDVARTILHVAREHKAAAIVVGSRGLGGLLARLEGSTSKSLLRHAPCPVLVVHERDEGGD